MDYEPILGTSQESTATTLKIVLVIPQSFATDDVDLITPREFGFHCCYVDLSANTRCKIEWL